MGGSSSLYCVKKRVYLLTLYVVESLPMGGSSSIFISFLFIKFVIGNWDILGSGAGMTVLMVSKDSSWPHDTRMIGAISPPLGVGGHDDTTDLADMIQLTAEKANELEMEKLKAYPWAGPVVYLESRREYIY